MAGCQPYPAPRRALLSAALFAVVAACSRGQGPAPTYPRFEPDDELRSAAGVSSADEAPESLEPSDNVQGLDEGGEPASEEAEATATGDLQRGSSEANEGAPDERASGARSPEEVPPEDAPAAGDETR